MLNEAVVDAYLTIYASAIFISEKENEEEVP